MSEHTPVSRLKCSCGEGPKLGDSIMRWWDKHILEVRAK